MTLSPEDLKTLDAQRESIAASTCPQRSFQARTDADGWKWGLGGRARKEGSKWVLQVYLGPEEGYVEVARARTLNELRFVVVA